MGTTLTGTTPQDTYDSLIKVTDNGPLSGSLKTLTDGLGNDSALALSTGAASITGTLAVSGATTLSSSATIGSSAYVGTAGIATIKTNSTILGATSELGLLIANDGTLNDLAQIGFGYSESRSAAVIAGIISTASGSTTSDLLFATRSGTVGSVAPTERLRITSAGNVGIGTSSPDTMLHLSNAAGGAIVRLERNDVEIEAGESYGQVQWEGQDASTLSAGIRASVDVLGTGNFGSTNMVFRVSGDTTSANVERFRITPNGVTFNGDTAAANALDDYEEGTWTPVFAQGSVGGTNNVATYDYQLGTYTKVGNLVTVFFDVEASSITAGSGTCTLKGLPFTVASAMAGYSCPNLRSMGVFNGVLINALATGFVEKSNTYIQFQQVSTTTGQETTISAYAASGRATGVVQYTV